MKIIKIEQEDKKGKSYIITDGSGDTHKISAEVYFKRNLKPDMDIDDDVLKELIFEDQLIKAKNKALGMLDIKMRTIKEVTDKLISLDFERSIIDKVILDLTGYGYLDDEEYTKKYINEKIKISGKHKIVCDLVGKGISRELISNLMDSDVEEEEYNACLNAALKKYPNLQNRVPDENMLRDKMYRFLISRGYGYDIIKRAYETVVDEIRNQA